MGVLYYWCYNQGEVISNVKGNLSLNCHHSLIVGRPVKVPPSNAAVFFHRPEEPWYVDEGGEIHSGSGEGKIRV